ncbi:MAG: ATP synthase F1 subunit delta [Dehalococcoidia bacterium]|nr:ATP synthase F1 subunit delta [Dehalococcoidia bacterium]
MAGEIAAKRHAQAVFQIAQEKGDFEKWRSDLDLMAAVFSNVALLPILENPKVRFEHKAKAVTQGLSGASEMALNLAKLLILKRTARIMPQIAQEYGRLVDLQQGIAHAEVITATPVDQSTLESFKQHLAQITGSKIVLNVKVDPAIIGGFVARVGDKVIDGSVRSRLQSLKQRIIQAG